MIELEKLLWEGLIGAGFASLGFAVLFNIRGRALWLAGITGGLGGFVYLGAKQRGASEAFANLLASIALSIVSEVFARWQKTTVTTFALCALIPLVPGGTAYQMMVDFFNNDLYSGLSQALSMASTALMLALGIILVSNFTRFLHFSKRKIQTTAHNLMDS